MGYSLSWLAIKGKAPRAVLDELGFRPTGERLEFPEAPLSAATIPNGWYLIVSDHTEYVASDSVLEHLTADCEAVTCYVEEHVMFSGATGWKNGRRCWSVNHDAQRNIEHLETEGELPASFNSIRDRLFSKQKEENIRKAGIRRPWFRRRALSFSEMACDYIFGIPVEVAREVTGYQHDRDIPGFRIPLTGRPFEVLIGAAPKESAPQQKPSFWKRLFRA
jgi:hypothetical protein